MKKLSVGQSSVGYNNTRQADNKSEDPAVTEQNAAACAAAAHVVQLQAIARAFP